MTTRTRASTGSTTSTARARRSPSATATPDNGQEPLTVTFSSLGSRRPRGRRAHVRVGLRRRRHDRLDGRQPDAPVHDAGRLPARASPSPTRPARPARPSIPVTVGNTRPTVEFNGPGQRRLRRLGRPRQLGRRRSPTPRTRVDYQDLIVQPALGHDAHAHPTARVPRQDRLGRHRPRRRPLGGHEGVLRARRPLHRQGRRHGVPALTGTDTVVLQPKHKEAEHADGRSGTDDRRRRRRRRAAATPALTGLDDGDWAAYEPVNFTGIDSITFRVASTQAGGAIELRKDCADRRRCSARPRCRRPAARSRWADVTIPAPRADGDDGACSSCSRAPRTSA